MKKASILLLCIAAFFVVLLYVQYPRNHNYTASETTASNISSNSTAITPPSQESSEIDAMKGGVEQSSIEQSRSTIYTVKEYEGRIGVFYNDDPTPYQEIDVDVFSLPAADQEALSTGIKVYSTDKLNQIIEDYES